SRFTDALFSDDGQWLATLASDGMLRFWPIPPAQFIGRLHVPLFTPDEREFFQIGGEEERLALRRSWNAGLRAKALILLARAGLSPIEVARSVRLSARDLLREAIDSLGPAATQSQIVGEYQAALKDIEEQCRPSSPVLWAFASAFEEAE